MKAIVYHQYGSPDVLELTEVEKPTPKDDEVLLKVHAASVNPADWHLLRDKPYIASGGLRVQRPEAGAGQRAHFLGGESGHPSLPVARR